MALPKFNEMYIPSLQVIANQEEMSTHNIRLYLKRYYNLSDKDYTEESSKGNNVFYGRVTWCLSDLFRAKLVEKPKQGTYRISELGWQKLSTEPQSVEQYILNTVRNLDKKKRRNRDKDKEAEVATTNTIDTPSDIIDEEYQKLKNIRKHEILGIILQKKPSEFERLTLALLKAMGYGGAIQNAHKQTKLSHDGGIDGIIKEDILGLGHIYIQAKRYTEGNNVGRTEIQQFVGAISTAQSNKGIFITTSDFSQGAYDYANKLTDKSIVLINGDQLTEYMYEYGLGVQCETIYETKKIDQDFWSNYIDE